MKPVLKIMRTEEAKQFPLLHIAKEGDVGMDIPACLPIKENPGLLLSTYMQRTDISEEDFKNLSQYELDKITHGYIAIYPGERATIPTGIHLEIPKGYWASIEARSSTSKLMLEVPKGVIDEGYRGELFGVLLNVGKEIVHIYHGDRYIQLIMHEKIIDQMDIEEVDELSESERGSSGFGSTGRSAR
jgi:dUTP pyrophosphatase